MEWTDIHLNKKVKNYDELGMIKFDIIYKGGERGENRNYNV